VLTSVMVTVALGTMAPLESVTVPMRLAVTAWDQAREGRSRRRRERKRVCMVNDFQPLLFCFRITDRRGGQGGLSRA